MPVPDHFINKSVMKKNSIEMLNQHGQPLKEDTAFSNLARNICNRSTKIIVIIIIIIITYLECDMSISLPGVISSSKLFVYLSHRTNREASDTIRATV